MKQRQAFLDSICAAPDDDTPRLVYADWLDDHGDADRAEFIRLQCELAHGVMDAERLVHLRQREQALLSEHRTDWEKEVPAWARRLVEFQRGFIAKVQGTALDFLKSADGLFHRAPVQAIHFRSYSERVGELARSPFLARLTTLSFRGEYGDCLDEKGARLLARSPHLSRLRVLDLGLCAIGPAGMKALAGAATLARLTTLVLNGNAIRPAGAQALANAPHLAGLAFVELGYNFLGDRGAAALAGSPHLGQLRELCLWDNGLTARGVRTLVEAPWRLSVLSLSRNPIGDEGAESLAGSANLAGLTTLLLEGANLTEAGARALAGSPHLANVTRLDLEDNAIGDAGACALAGSSHLANLRELNLQDSDIGDEGGRALADSPHLRNLVRLDLSGNSFGKATVARLKKRFGNEGVIAFAR